jgi:hypothetical protein
MQSRAYQKKKDDGEVIEKTAYEVSLSKIEYVNLTDEDPDVFNEMEEDQAEPVRDIII